MSEQKEWITETGIGKSNNDPDDFSEMYGICENCKEESKDLIQGICGDCDNRYLEEEGFFNECRICGCTGDNACEDKNGEPCFWIEDDLCSVCNEKIKGEKSQ